MKVFLVISLLLVVGLSLRQDPETPETFNVMYLKNAIKANLAEAEGNENGLTCNFCKSKIKDIQTWDLETLSVYIKKIFAKICPAIEPATVCQGIEESYVDSFIVHFFTHILNPQDVCANLSVCEHTYTIADIKKFIEQNLKDVLTDAQKAEWTVKSKTKIQGNENYKVLHLADLHIDMEYAEGTHAFCNEPHCCRPESVYEKGEKKAAEHWGTLGPCDLPVHTLQNMIDFISEDLDVDMILWTGDNTSHDVWHQSQAKQTIPTRVITEYLKSRFPNTPFYPIYGNHEAFPADQYDMNGDQTQWLKNEVADMWSGILGEQEIQSLRTRGFYSSYYSERNLRVIALNTQACDSLNFFLMEQITDPGNELAWLKQQLQEAEDNNEFAFIFAHIPPGDTFCGSQWSERYSVLVERYVHVIKGQFYGHTHNDHIETTVSRVDGRPLTTAFIAPSGTTYTYQNPSFRIFEVNAADNSIHDYTQYRLNLQKANTDGHEADLEWEVAYTFLSQYGLKSASDPHDVLELVTKLKQDKQLLRQYIKHFWAGSEVKSSETIKYTINFITHRDLDSLIYGTSVKNYYLCGIETGTFDDYYNCVGKLYKFKDYNFIMFKFLEELTGKWREPIAVQEMVE